MAMRLTIRASDEPLDRARLARRLATLLLQAEHSDTTTGPAESCAVLRSTCSLEGNDFGSTPENIPTAST